MEYVVKMSPPLSISLHLSLSLSLSSSLSLSPDDWSLPESQHDSHQPFNHSQKLISPPHGSRLGTLLNVEREEVTTHGNVVTIELLDLSHTLVFVRLS